MTTSIAFIIGVWIFAAACAVSRTVTSVGFILAFFLAVALSVFLL